MINSAYEARELANKADNSRISALLELIEYMASAGLYFCNLNIYPVPDNLVKELRIRGFSVNQKTGYVSW